MNDDCVFCKIIKGEIPSFTIYEDEKFKVILDRFPSAKGHMLVLPKKHFENIFEIDDEYAESAMVVAKKMATLLADTYKPAGINILQNNGEAAGQTVFHYHIHIIPRYDDDKIRIGWNSKNFELDDLKVHQEELTKLK